MYMRDSPFLWSRYLINFASVPLHTCMVFLSRGALYQIERAQLVAHVIQHPLYTICRSVGPQSVLIGSGCHGDGLCIGVLYFGGDRRRERAVLGV